MEGNIINEYIAVNCWKNNKPYAHFLTRLDIETMNILIDGQFTSQIYSSEHNINILKRITKVDHKFLKAIKPYEPTAIFVNRITITVTLCPTENADGSVMFLFKCPNETIFYTGCFRFESALLENNFLLSLGENEIIDTLYIDNTAMGLPIDFSTDLAVEQVKNIVKNNSNYQFVLSAPIWGMEQLMFGIAKAGIKVFPGSNRLQSFKSAGLIQYFSENRSDTIRVVWNNTVILSDIERRYKTKKIITLFPTLDYTLSESNLKEIGMYFITYDDIFSPQNIDDFVKMMNPKCVYPICQNEYVCNEALKRGVLHRVNNSKIPLASQDLTLEPRHEEIVIDVPQISELNLPTVDKRTAVQSEIISSTPNDFDEFSPCCNTEENITNPKRKEYQASQNTFDLSITQSEFIPMTASTQNIEYVENTQSSQPISTLPNSQLLSSQPPKNINRFIDMDDNQLRLKNKLSRIQPWQVFSSSSINRASLVSKGCKTMEVACQTDLQSGDITLRDKCNITDIHINTSDINATDNDLPLTQSTQTGISITNEVQAKRKVNFNCKLNIVHEITEISSDATVLNKTNNVSLNASSTDSSTVIPLSQFNLRYVSEQTPDNDNEFVESLSTSIDKTSMETDAVELLFQSENNRTWDNDIVELSNTEQSSKLRALEVIDISSDDCSSESLTSPLKTEPPDGIDNTINMTLVSVNLSSNNAECITSVADIDSDFILSSEEDIEMEDRTHSSVNSPSSQLSLQSIALYESLPKCRVVLESIEQVGVEKGIEEFRTLPQSTSPESTDIVKSNNKKETIGSKKCVLNPTVKYNSYTRRFPPMLVSKRGLLLLTDNDRDINTESLKAIAYFIDTMKKSI